MTLNTKRYCWAHKKVRRCLNVPQEYLLNRRLIHANLSLKEKNDAQERVDEQYYRELAHNKVQFSY